MNRIANEFVILPTETFISENNYILSHITTKQFKKESKKEEWKNKSKLILQFTFYRTFEMSL